MKRILIFSVFVFAFILSTLAITMVNAESKLSPSQKQEILEVLKRIEKRTEEIKEYNKRRDDLGKGEDETYNNIPMVKDLQKEGKDIQASPVGQRLERKMRGWDKSEKTKPITDFLDEEETEALKRIMHIGDELDEIYNDEIDKIYQFKRGSETSLAYYEGELKKLEGKYGKFAVGAVKNQSVKGKKEKISSEDSPRLQNVKNNYINCVHNCCKTVDGAWLTAEASKQKSRQAAEKAVKTGSRFIAYGFSPENCETSEGCCYENGKYGRSYGDCKNTCKEKWVGKAESQTIN